MRTSLTDALPYITGAFLGLAVLAFAWALRLFRRSRTDAYWRKRRAAGRRGLRLVTLAVALFALSGISCAGTLAVSWLGEKPPTPTSAPLVAMDSPTASVAPLTEPPSVPTWTATSPPLLTTPPETVVVVVTATPAATPTPTAFPTFTQEIAPQVTQTAATPSQGGRLSIIALDDRISEELQPINPRVTFVAGTPRVYVFLRYAGMSAGLPWRRELRRDGQLVESTEYTWGEDAQGSTYFFFGSAEGFVEGSYEVRIFLGDDSTPAATAQFSVLPAP